MKINVNNGKACYSSHDDSLHDGVPSIPREISQDIYGEIYPEH